MTDQLNTQGIDKAAEAKYLRACEAALWCLRRIVTEASDLSHITGGKITTRTHDEAVEILDRAGI